MSFSLQREGLKVQGLNGNLVNNCKELSSTCSISKDLKYCKRQSPGNMHVYKQKRVQVPIGCADTGYINHQVIKDPDLEQAFGYANLEF